MKKLINAVENIVTDELTGMAVAYPDLIKVHFDPNFVYRADAPVRGKVAIVSGGGSGHEPIHTGFVGMGMLDAACPGEVFTGPSVGQILEATRTVNGDAGVLFIVKNYVGDVMNFQAATEQARTEGIRVLNILIDDDVAVDDSLYTQGRRGLGTSVLAEKICGSAAEAGYNLKQVADLCRRVNLNGRSIGMALTACTVPVAARPTFEIGDDEIEIGVGIHGEPGQERMKLKSADEITEMMALTLIEDDAYTRTVREWDESSNGWVEVELTDPPFRPGDQLIGLVNSMGGTPLSELYIVWRKLVEVCDKKGLPIVRNLIGPYITSLEMQGCSITLLKVDDEMLKLWDAPVKTASLRWGI